MRIGGTMIMHNPLRYDYCVREALVRLLQVTDYVVALNCESNDGTDEMLRDLEKKFKHLKVYSEKWDILPDKHRLSALTNIATGKLPENITWALNVQADEVLMDHVDHDLLEETIRAAEANGCDGAIIDRINLWGDFDHFIPDRYPNKPVSNSAIRLTRTHCKSVDDGESFRVQKAYNARYAIRMIHYGFVRNPFKMVDKMFSMQSWFGYGVDKKIIEQKERSGRFEPEAWHKIKDLQQFTGKHPEIMSNWIAERKGYYNG